MPHQWEQFPTTAQLSSTGRIRGLFKFYGCSPSTMAFCQVLFLAVCAIAQWFRSRIRAHNKLSEVGKLSEAQARIYHLHCLSTFSQQLEQHTGKYQCQYPLGHVRGTAKFALGHVRGTAQFKGITVLEPYIECQKRITAERKQLLQMGPKIERQAQKLNQLLF